MKRRFFALGIGLILIFTMFPCVASADDTWDGTTVDTAWYGPGTSFTLSTGAQLAGLAQLVNTGADHFDGKTILLEDNINLAGHPWTPIGTSAHPFNGTFDGCGFAVSGLAIGSAGTPDSSLDYLGLFGYAGGSAIIENLNVLSVGIYSSNKSAQVGGIAGHSGIVSNCSAAGSVSGGVSSVVGVLAGTSYGAITQCSSEGSAFSDYTAGGLVGWIHNTITQSSSSADVTAGEMAGGLAGCSEPGTGAISGCTAAGGVTATDAKSYAGGLIGLYYGAGSITNCDASGSAAVTDTASDDSYAGGLIGHMTATNTIEMSGCAASGDVTAAYGDYAGGLMGWATDGSLQLNGCYATGDVTAGDVAIAGGLVGYSTCVADQCFACGDVTGGSDCLLGGFAGYNFGDIQNSYAAGSVAGGMDSDIGGLVGNNSIQIATCYARGNVSGVGADVGGLIGYNGDGGGYGTASGCYFDTQGTGQADGIGTDENSQTVTALTASRMTGTGASDNLTTFDFTSYWQEKANDSKWYYPQLSVFAGSGDSAIKAASLESVTFTPFTVAFNSNGGSAVADKYGYYTAVAKPTDPTLAGCVFAGWYSDSGLTTAYDFSASVTSNKTLYAKWTKLTLSSSDADGKIYTGGRITLTPNIDGGTWSWDKNFFTATFNSPATFTALKKGTSTITYTVSGASTTYTVSVAASSLPSTGQDFTWVWAFAGAGIAALIAGSVLVLNRRKRSE